MTKVQSIYGLQLWREGKKSQVAFTFTKAEASGKLFHVLANLVSKAYIGFVGSDFSPPTMSIKSFCRD